MYYKLLDITIKNLAFLLLVRNITPRKFLEKNQSKFYILSILDSWFLIVVCTLIFFAYNICIIVCFNEKHEFYLVVRSHSLEIILKVVNYMLQKTHHHNSFKLLVFAVLSTRVQWSWNAKNVRKIVRKKNVRKNE